MALGRKLKILNFFNLTFQSNFKMNRQNCLFNSFWRFGENYVVSRVLAPSGDISRGIGKRWRGVGGWGDPGGRGEVGGGGAPGGGGGRYCRCLPLPSGMNIVGNKAKQ